MGLLSHLKSDHQFLNTFQDQKEHMWSPLTPHMFPNPQLATASQETLDLLEISEETTKTPDFQKLFSGGDTKHPSYATCYGGHQFGRWAGQLGDGRAMHIGEYINSSGERWDLQLKGSGPTAYSRGADGKAVLRSSIREFLCSEAMHHLGVPTTRALSLIRTGEDILRDKLYDGHPADEPGAVVCRMAPSFLRFGHFEILAARQQHDKLRQLIDFTISRDFPHLQSTPSPRAQWFQEVCKTTAELMAHWQRVGFVHGVMNTDNMSILGLTIDYGPYGWIEPYDPEHTPNTTDLPGRRYAFGQQPQVALWNLGCLANAIAPIFDDHQPLYDGVEIYKEHFHNMSNTMTAHKFGMHDPQPQGLYQEAFDLMAASEADHTLFFRALAASLSDLTLSTLSPSFYQDLSEDLKTRWSIWLTSYKTLCYESGGEDTSRISLMNQTNPCYILRNSIVHSAILASEHGDDTELLQLQKLIKNPYVEQPASEQYQQKRPEWAEQEFGCSMLSCSS